MLAPITHVLGARPNFVKAAPVIRALAALGNRQLVVHTGQHYDERLSDVFFVQLGLPEPDVNLGVGSGSHAQQTAAAMTGLEQDFTEHPPGLVVDTIHLVGNPMIDTLMANLDRFDTAAVRAELDLPERYVVATLHRPANVDDPEIAGGLVRALHEIAAVIDVVIPVHPRGRAVLEAAGLSSHRGVHAVPPLGYLEFMGLVRGAAAVATDSGGVQEETTLLRVPCLTVRPNTERPITITHGSNRLITSAELASAVLKACDDGPYTGELPPLWDGHAGPRIGRIITDWLARDG